ncbi:GNAT family N-acetyltransferase [Actinokineospora soli]|uniref:GNAT family N-acetyltransferase n=1 Tax=Actinokineospora soli TaxID=1048753 RepID=A0ABW2TJ78_9PSEU
MVPLWTRATGQVPSFTMGLRLHRLEDFTQIGAPGRFRHAEDTDVPLLGQWWDAFEAEDFGTARGDGEVQVRHEISHGVRRFGFWTDGGEEPVAMAGGSPPLHGMSRIGPVYTPKEFRGRGYGTAVTAAMTRWALDEGARDVLLFTDIANPVSNAIYHRIGYRPVMEAVEHRMPDANTLDV